MAIPAPALQRSWSCLGQPSGVDAHAGDEDRYASEAAFLHAQSFSRGVDERDVVTALASSDQVCVLSRSHEFSQALPFWEAFSASEETERAVTCVCVGYDPMRNESLVAASMDHRIAVWAASTNSSRRWRVHSTVMVNDGCVTSIDIGRGKLLIGTSTSLSLWQLEQSSIGIWRRVWRKRCPSPIRIARFSPDGGAIAAATEGGQNVLLWSLPRKTDEPPSLTQRIFHPYPISSVVWRHPPDRAVQSDVLITYSQDGVARIWAPVIDEPSKLRLWASLDTSPEQSRRSASTSACARPFYLEACVVASALRSNIGALERELQMMELGLGGDATKSDAHQIERATDTKRTRLRRLQQLLSEAPDMFLKVEDDGSLTISAVANIDRKPPTLFQNLTVLKLPACLPVDPSDVADVALHPRYAGGDASSEDAFAVMQIRTLSGATATVEVNPALFFDGRGKGLLLHGTDLLARSSEGGVPAQTPIAAHRSRIARLERSCNGLLLTSTSSTETIVWTSGTPGSAGGVFGERAEPIAEPLAVRAEISAIARNGLFHAALCGSQVRITALSGPFKGRYCTTSSTSEDVAALHFALIADVHYLVSCTKDACTSLWRISEGPDLEIVKVAEDRLPFAGTAPSKQLVAVVPVVGVEGTTAEAALFATVSAGGLLERWQLRQASPSVDPRCGGSTLAWQRESSVQTDARDAVMVSCSSSGLNALVSNCAGGQQRLSIYNSKASTFASGLEFEKSYDADEPIAAMDWSPSGLTGSVLAVAFGHHIELLGPTRSPVHIGDDGIASSAERWSPCGRIDLATCTPSKIRGLAWLTRGRIVVASASSMFIYGPRCEATDLDARRTKHIAEVVAERTGPLPQYHPAFLEECLLWNNLDVAKSIIANLKSAVSAVSPDNVDEAWDFCDVPLESFASIGAGRVGASSPNGPKSRAGPTSAAKHGRSIFDDASDEEPAEDELTSKSVEPLMRSLATLRIPHLSNDDTKALGVIIRTVCEAEEQRRSLDDNGLRFLMSLRLLLNRPENGNLDEGMIVGSLDYQDAVWAYHSENQEPLLAAIEAGFRNKLTWSLARATRVFMWLKSHTALRTAAENVARAQFIVGEDRDPVKCSLLYFALGKPKVVLGLWKQAVWHPEQKKMLQFLSKDFSQDRWKTAAQKNAFALLSQRRYEFAASFFLLGDSLQDAVNVCVRNLNDLDLAIALARIREGNDDGPVLRSLLQNKILPQVFEKGRRWLGTWAFWMLKRRDLAVRIIVSPLSELLADPQVSVMLPAGTACSDGHTDDASLAILFKQLKNRSLQTLRGTAAISEKKEFNFVLHTNRLLCRMGCHLLGLNLLRTWEFEPPVVASSTTQYHTVSKQDLATLSRMDQVLSDEPRDTSFDLVTAKPRDGALRKRASNASMSPPSSPTLSRRRSSLLRRRSSILNDLDIGSPAGPQRQHPHHSHPSSGASTIDGHRQEPSAPIGSSTIFQHHPPHSVLDARTSAPTITEEPATLEDKTQVPNKATKDAAAPPDALPEADAAPPAAAADEAKPKGVSIFKSAAASNASQGAQEFDFGSFGF
ncbi:regulator of (H+)-ATPase in vacuolar membrane [Thecaphora frezii]